MSGASDAHAEAVREEQRRARQLRIAVDLATATIAQGRMTRAEAEELVAATRRHALALFPDKGATFDLILAPRFARLMDEHTIPPARILPFPGGRRQG
jgi:hypothetical protein